MNCNAAFPVSDEEEFMVLDGPCEVVPLIFGLLCLPRMAVVYVKE